MTIFKSQKLLWLFQLLFIAALGMSIFLYFNTQKKPLPVYGEVPDFSLTERSGRSFSKGDLTGKPWVASFIFTRCQDQCLIMNGRTKALHQALKSIHFVSFSVDPVYDSPEVLRQYAERFDARDNWHFLTGDAKTINRLTTSLKMNRIDEPMMHSVSFVLVDGKGRVRGYYDSNDEEAITRLKADVKNL